MTGLYRYSIIRFRPFAETGEFANIGVIVTEIGTGRSAFRLAAKRFGRVKHFFDDLAYDSYRYANGFIRKELERVVKELPLLRSNSDDYYQADFIKERESSVIFSKPRIIKSHEDLEEVTDSLYGRYIGRNFAASENVEAALTRDLRANLKERGITHFKSLRLDDEVVPVILPLAYRSDHIYAIKPMAFSQKTPLSVFDHGASWKNRFEYLLDKNKLISGSVLLALEPPMANDSAFQEAYHLVRNELDQLPFDIVVADHSNNMLDSVARFAAKVPRNELSWTRH